MNLITKKKSLRFSQQNAHILSQHPQCCVLQIDYSGVCTQGFKGLSSSTNKDAIIMDRHPPTVNVTVLVDHVFLQKGNIYTDGYFMQSNTVGSISFSFISLHFSLSLCLSLLFVSPESCLWTLCRIAVLPVYGTAAINSSKCHAKAQRPCSNKTTAEAKQAWLGCRGSLCSPTKQGQSISSVSMQACTLTSKALTRCVKSKRMSRQQALATLLFSIHCIILCFTQPSLNSHNILQTPELGENCNTILDLFFSTQITLIHHLIL